MPENTNKVIQLQDNEGNDVSPVVNVGSIYDKNGQKIDNLLSYVVAGTDVPIPEVGDITDNLQDQVDQMVSTATSQVNEMVSTATSQIDAKLDAVDEALGGIDTAVDDKLSSGGLPINDVRTYPVREGEVIHAGDVVNVGKGVVSGTTYGDLAVGSIVQINENGSPVDYIVVHQGNPNTGIYDASCDGTWLLRKDALHNIVYNDNNNSDYTESSIPGYFTNTYLPTIDSTVAANIKTVKLPYADDQKDLHTGANGFECKAFILADKEVGFTAGDVVDSAKLSYFISGSGAAAKTKRVALYNGAAVTCYTRTPHTSASVVQITAAGARDTYNVGSAEYIRPCFICDSSAYRGDDTVYGPDTIYKDVVPQDNVENLLYSTALSDISLCYLNDDFSIAALKSSANSITDVYIVNNKTGLGEGSSRLSSDYHQYVKVAKLSDTKFISLYVGSSVYSKIGTVSGTSISFGSQYTVASSASNNADVIALSDILALSIYNSSGLKCKVLPISGTTIATSGTVYSLSGNTGARYISACKLPDDSSGNKRVCICFSGTGDGNKGKAVIATIDSSNAVTFGDVVTLTSSAIIITSCASDGNAILISTSGNTSGNLFLLDMNLSTLDTADGKIGVIENIKANTYVFHGTNGNAIPVLTSGNSIRTGESYPVNGGGSTSYPSLAAISKNQVLLAYTDNGNSMYGTTTILEVSGNQIAGSFIDNSSDAIALADGTGGQSIPVGFGGYCECPEVTEGKTITSDGVNAFSPLGGWLKIFSVAEQSMYPKFFSGLYTGNGSTMTINVGKKPYILFCHQTGGNGNTIISSVVGGTINFRGSYLDTAPTVTFTDTGVKISKEFSNKSYKYKYIILA